MLACKHCGSSSIVKDGMVNKKQRYLCRSCKKTTREGDKRERYTMRQKMRVIKLYTEGVGIRTIERLEGVSAPLVVVWIRHFSRMIKEKLAATKIPENAKDIEILEIDELFTYYQKKAKKPIYGLLWTETGTKLLIS